MVGGSTRECRIGPFEGDRVTTALVLGKFYPPHPGHLHLLSVALASHERVALLCLGSSQESFTPQRRLQALMEDARAAALDVFRIIPRSGLDEAPFDLDDEACWQSHLGVFVAHLHGLPRLDAVVTSESYGVELARRLGIRHVACDLRRVRVPLSATAIRADPIGHWGFLGPGTRAMLAARVVLLGAESTGTSTVAMQLVQRLRTRGTPWDETRLVEEYGRELTIRKQELQRTRIGKQDISVTWHADDFAEVAAVQAAREDEAARAGSPVLVCDTDAFATPTWERRYLSTGARLNAGDHGLGDVYLLTSHEGVPFVQDGTRDGEHLRAGMTINFTQELIRHGRPWAMLTGPLGQRLDLAERITDRIVQRKLAFASPP